MQLYDFRDLPGYQLTEQVHESRHSIVYRGHRQRDQLPVVLKMLKQAEVVPERIAVYHHEFQLLQQLALAGVVRAYTFEADQPQPFIVLEDFGGSSVSSLQLAGTLGLEAFLHMAITISSILGQVHAANMVHKDINPNNIVYNPDNAEIKIIDFSISSVLSRETQSFKTPNGLEGTLAYLSPEQTGRMNRAIDYRSDYYALGVTFYELLTGQLPFTSDDALALIHSHIARQPLPPHELSDAIPPALSAIIMKLMAKNAEDRYQSAYGLQADLEHCRRQLAQHGHIAPFSLGEQEICDHFHIPQTLYGRVPDIEALLQGFERVSQGDSELLLVAGYSGVGKSALVCEVYKPITAKCAHFIAGKYDQYQRNIPYMALSQAFNELCHQWLSESEVVLAEWREHILAAIQPNAQVLIDVIPKLEWVLGEQPPVAQVGPQESQNRFNLVFQSFIKAVCQPEHPLVLFVDDLQWADSASLNLLKILTTDPESQCLFIIGAYRNNEVGPTHSLSLTLKSIQENGGQVSEIYLDNLTQHDVQQLLGDTLSCSTEAIEPLACLVHAKTQGNAFFTNEFIKSLYTEQLITFCHDQRTWKWELEAVEAKQITDNVVTLMAGKIGDLDAETQTILQIAACIGNTFDQDTLALISQQSPHKIQAQLESALRECLVFALSDKKQFRFQHDRVQQAAYKLIEDQNVQTIHWQIGKLLLAHSNDSNRENRLFEIVDHLNIARDLMTDDQELTALAGLNLEAGHKAKDAAAYQASEDYVRAGIACLQDQFWACQYDLAFTLHRLLAEVKQLQGEFQESETLIHMLLGNEDEPLVKAELYYLLTVQDAITGRFRQAIAAGRQALALLGVELPEDKERLQDDLKRHLQQVHEKLAPQTIPTLLDAPEVTDAQQVLIIKLLNSLVVPSYVTEQVDLYWLIALKIVDHSCDYGMTAESAYGFVAYGMYLGSVLGDYQTGYDYGAFALELSIKFNKLDYVAQICYSLGNNVQPWVKPLHTSQQTSDEGIQAALASGCFLYLGYLLSYKLLNTFYEGRHIKTLLENLSTYFLEMQRKSHQIAEDIILALHIVLAAFTDHINVDVDEDTYVQCLKEQDPYALCHYYILKCMTSYHFGVYREALYFAEQADELIGILPSKYQVAAHTFYHSLSMARLYDQSSPSVQANYWERLSVYRQQLKVWADHCPDNFEHQYCLVEAEIAALSKRDAEAMALYDQAIKAAYQQGFMHQAALANEHAAHYWLAKEKPRFAKIYLHDAHLGYHLWGADRMVYDLEQRYYQFFTEPSPESQPSLRHATAGTSTTTSGRLSTEMDFASVLKASQALGREVQLKTLLSTLMRIMLENAGAERGCLILHQDGQWLIQASGTCEEGTVKVLQACPIQPSSDATVAVCDALANYVIRTQESTVLHDAGRIGNFTNDPYIVRHQSKSILCSPLLNQGNVVGLIYLENNLTTGAFTPERVEVLDMLMTQAAISLENARLYSDLQQLNADLEDRVHERTQQLQQAQQDLIAQAHRAGMADIAANVLHNVGNVLTSVTTSASVIASTVNDSHITKLFKANDLLRQHADHLDTFVTQDDKAVKLMRYYLLIDEQLHQEQLEVLENIEMLRNKIQLINEIVVAQQNYAQGGALVEVLSLEEVVEMALTLQEATVERHRVELERVYAPVPLVQAQKTKLVHVLVNLLKNATEAMSNVDPGQKRLRIMIEADETMAYIRVQDTGCGIAPLMLKTIFTHGTTTKTDGHGFGLHSSANYMTEMGGRLWAESAGETQGATFVVALPYDAQPSEMP